MSDQITCMICGKNTSQMTAAHLRTHSISMAEYRNLYPDAPIRSSLISQKVSASLKTTALEQGKKAGRKRLEYNLEDTVGCEICGARQQQITQRHLALHGLSMAEYKDRYPDAVLVNQAIRYRISDGHMGRTVSPETKIRISQKNKGKQHFGRKLSQASKELISIASSAMTDEGRRIINDPQLLENAIKAVPVAELSAQWNINISVIYKRASRLGITFSRSNCESAVVDLVKTPDVDITLNSRKIIPPYELDIYIPDQKFAIEVCGLYWHSDAHVDDSYHLRKLQLCQEKGIRLITMFEDEINDRWGVIKTAIAHRLGKGIRGPYARQLTIREIPVKDGRAFCDQYHMQKGARADTCIGAFDGDQLCAVMLFGRSFRFLHQDNAPIELIRFATDGRSFAGVASRLLSHYRKMDGRALVSYADRRWSDGDLYHSLGFAMTKVVRPTYYYIVKKSRVSKEKYRLDKIRHLVPEPEGKTERAIMKELGHHRIYDCGHLRFELR